MKDDGWFWHPAPNRPCVFWMSHRLERDSTAGAPGTAPSVVGGPRWAAGILGGTAMGTSKSSPVLFQLQILPRRQTMLFLLLFFIILGGWCITQARFYLGSQGLEVGLMDFMQMS